MAEEEEEEGPDAPSVGDSVLITDDEGDTAEHQIDEVGDAGEDTHKVRVGDEWYDVYWDTAEGQWVATQE